MNLEPQVLEVPDAVRLLDEQSYFRVEALGQVKACDNRMTNGKRPNLSFITDENTVMKLTRGFEYDAE